MEPGPSEVDFQGDYRIPRRDDDRQGVSAVLDIFQLPIKEMEIPQKCWKTPDEGLQELRCNDRRTNQLRRREGGSPSTHESTGRNQLDRRETETSEREAEPHLLDLRRRELTPNDRLKGVDDCLIVELGC